MDGIDGESLFLSTPSVRRATFDNFSFTGFCKFLSTPSVRRATATESHGLPEKPISIHALREEGDMFEMLPGLAVAISIHALREEGD